MAEETTQIFTNDEYGTIIHYQKHHQYGINLLHGNGQLKVSDNVPIPVMINALLDPERTKESVHNACVPYLKRNHTGELRMSNPTTLVWGKDKDKTKITISSKIDLDSQMIIDDIKSIWNVLAKPYSKDNFEEVKSIVDDIRSYLKQQYGIRVRLRNKPKHTVEKQVTLDFADSMKLEKQLEAANAEIYDLQKELNDYKKFGLLLRKKKEFKCPNCGAPLKWIQLKDSENTKQTNRGRLAVCCTDKSRKGQKGRCAYLRPIDELDYYVHHQEIVHFSSFLDGYRKGEWEVTNPRHPNFISPRILEWHKCFIEALHEH